MYLFLAKMVKELKDLASEFEIIELKNKCLEVETKTFGEN